MPANPIHLRALTTSQTFSHPNNHAHGDGDPHIPQTPSDIDTKCSKQRRRRKAGKGIGRSKGAKLKMSSNSESTLANHVQSQRKQSRSLTKWTGLSAARKRRMSNTRLDGMEPFISSKLKRKTKPQSAKVLNVSVKGSLGNVNELHANDISNSHSKVWPGLSKSRKKSRITNSHFSALRQTSLNAIFLSALQSPHRPVQRTSLLFAAAKAHGWSPPFTLSDPVVIMLIDSIMREAEKNRPVMDISSSGADVACEILFRCLDAFDIRPSADILMPVLRVMDRDPVVERRSTRAMSMLRYARGVQLSPTEDFVYECFKVCVSGLDIEACAMLMEYAFELELCRDMKSLGKGPLRIDYFNGVMYAALLLQDFNTLSVSQEELMRQEIEPNGLTESIFLATSFDRGDERCAKILLTGMQKKEAVLEEIVFASMLRCAGHKRDTGSVLGLYREYEKQSSFDAGLMWNVPYQGANGSWSTRASASARGDATFSLFQALRTCGAAEESFEQFRYLKDKYHCKPSRSLYALVIEACWKGGRLDLAKKLRNEMEMDLFNAKKMTK